MIKSIWKLHKQEVWDSGGTKLRESQPKRYIICAILGGRSRTTVEIRGKPPTRYLHVMGHLRNPQWDASQGFQQRQVTCPP